MNGRAIRRVRSPRGFTLTELLVSIAILAILLAILLPAVQFAREGARKAFCQNNLRQHGLGLWLFDDKQVRMPPLWVNMFDSQGEPLAGNKRPAEHRSLGWRIRLLPFLEQEALFRQLDLRRSALDAKNRAVLSVEIRLFQCPATPKFSRRFVYEDQLWGATDYQAPEYFNDLPCAWLGDLGDPVDVYRQWSRSGTPGPRFDNILDGLSNTVQLFEQAGQPDSYSRGGEAWEDALGQGGWGMAGGRVLRSAEPTGAINHENGLGVFAFHPGGANAAMCDGSVRFFAESMELLALQALFTREELDRSK